MSPKWGKSTDHDHNLISSQGDQDTSTCQISGNSSHVFSRKCPETSTLTCFSNSKRRQNEENSNRPWPKSNQFWRWSGYISMSNFRAFLPCVLQKMPRNHNFDLFNKVKAPPLSGIHRSESSPQGSFAIEVTAILIFDLFFDLVT